MTRFSHPHISRLRLAACIAAVAALHGLPAHAQQAGAPSLIGTYEDWRAASFQDAGKKVCYVLTDATSSQPQVRGRGTVVLTVALHPGGQDDVAIRPVPPQQPKGAEVTMTVGNSSFPFTADVDAVFARDGRAVIPAFRGGSDAKAVWKEPGSKDIEDVFSLRGFTAAYEAASKACGGK